MLLIVVNDEEAEDQQAGEDAADDLRGGMEVDDAAGERCDQEKAGGNNMPPTARGGIFGKGFGSEDEFRPGPESRLGCRCNDSRHFESCLTQSISFFPRTAGSESGADSRANSP